MMYCVKGARSALVLFVCLLSVALAACGESEEATPETEETFVLKVALYPYIPDAGKDEYASLLADIEERFEEANPGIDLRMRSVDLADDFYGADQLSAWLTNDVNAVLDGGYHVVEIDALLLGELVNRGVIGEWSDAPGQADWHDAGLEASTLNGVLYGVPHLLCGHFLFTHDEEVASATSLPELLGAMNREVAATADLTGNFLGSWNMPALYLDAWADHHGGDGLSGALTVDLDEDVLASLSAFAEECEVAGANPCLDETFDGDYDAAAVQFAEGESESTFGYSERLYGLIDRGANAATLQVLSIPMGPGSTPVVFVDSYVRRADCEGRCVEATQAFATFMTSPETQERLLLSKDAGEGATPRYVIPAQHSAYETEGVKADRLFGQLRQSMEGAVALPSEGLPGLRKAMRDKISETVAAP